MELELDGQIADCDTGGKPFDAALPVVHYAEDFDVREPALSTLTLQLGAQGVQVFKTLEDGRD